MLKFNFSFLYFFISFFLHFFKDIFYNKIITEHLLKGINSYHIFGRNVCFYFLFIVCTFKQTMDKEFENYVVPNPWILDGTVLKVHHWGLCCLFPVCKGLNTIRAHLFCIQATVARTSRYYRTMLRDFLWDKKVWT